MADLLTYAPGIPRYVAMWLLASPLVLGAAWAAGIRGRRLALLGATTLPTLFLHHAAVPVAVPFPLRWAGTVTSAGVIGVLLARELTAGPAATTDLRRTWTVPALESAALLVVLAVVARASLAWVDPFISDIPQATEAAARALLDGANPYVAANPYTVAGVYQYPAGSLLWQVPFAAVIPAGPVAGEEWLAARAAAWTADALVVAGLAWLGVAAARARQAWARAAGSSAARSVPAGSRPDGRAGGSASAAHPGGSSSEGATTGASAGARPAGPRATEPWAADAPGTPQLGGSGAGAQQDGPWPPAPPVASSTAPATAGPGAPAGGKVPWTALVPAAVYALHPTLVRETGLTVANDVWMGALVAACGLCLAGRRTTLAGVALGLAVAVKPPAVVLVPALVVLAGWRPVLVGGGVAAALQLGFLLWPTPGLQGIAALAEPAARAADGYDVLRFAAWWPVYAAAGTPGWLVSAVGLVASAAAALTGWVAARRVRHRAGQALHTGAVLAVLALPLLVVFLLAPGWRPHFQDWMLPAAALVAVAPLLALPARTAAEAADLDPAGGVPLRPGPARHGTSTT